MTVLQVNHKNDFATIKVVVSLAAIHFLIVWLLQAMWWESHFPWLYTQSIRNEATCSAHTHSSTPRALTRKSNSINGTKGVQHGVCASPFASQQLSAAPQKGISMQRTNFTVHHVHVTKFILFYSVPFHLCHDAWQANSSTTANSFGHCLKRVTTKRSVQCW